MDLTHRLLVVGAAALALAACDPGHQVGELASEGVDRTVPDVAATQRAVGPEGGNGNFRADLEVSDQTSDGEAVVVHRAEFDPVAGWVAVSTDDEGAPGEVIGHQRIQGEETDLVVALDRALDPGEHTLWAVVHLDGGISGEFEWPGADEPLVSAVDDVVRERFTVTVEG